MTEMGTTEGSLFEVSMHKLLLHPLTRDITIDDPRTTMLRKKIIEDKAFLRKIYHEWYSWIASRIPPGSGSVLELGSGAGFLHEYVQGVITSEVFRCGLVKAVLDGCSMPVRTGSLKAIVMVDVFHHVPDARCFLKEAIRTLRSGGCVIMVEPWITTWSRFVYRRLHHEPVDTEATSWAFPAAGPLSGANSALPWIVFSRDREVYESEFPHLHITGISIERPFSYILSGGVSMRNLMPGWIYGTVRRMEACLTPWMDRLGMFARIELSRL